MRSQLADIQHEIWSHWMTYLFKVSVQNEDGSVTIPADKVESWKRLIQTRYGDLTDKERESDLEQADKVIAKLKQENVTL